MISLMTFQLIYAIVVYEPRYRIPIDWILYALAGDLVWKMMGGPIGTLLADEE